MKDSYGIKELYGVQEEGMGVEEEFVSFIMQTHFYS